jgi:hypothetical protein
MIFRSSDPALNLAMFCIAVIVAVMLVAIGAFMLWPLALGFAAWKGYEWYKSRPVKTADLVATATVTLQERIPFPSPEEFLGAHIDHLFAAWGQSPPHYDLYQRMVGAAGSLYEAEEVSGLPVLPEMANAIEEARYRDRLVAYVRKTQDTSAILLALNRAFTQSFSALLEHPITRTTLDRFAPEKQLPVFGEVAIVDVIPNVGETITGMMAPYFAGEIIEKGLFKELRKQFDLNIKTASGEARKSVLPQDHKGTPRHVAAIYLYNTPLAPLFDSEVPFEPKEETRFSGHWIIASQGKGKTTLLTAMCMQDFEKDAAVIIMDGKGDLIAEVGNLADYQDRYVVIDPRQECGMNPLDITGSDITHAVELLEYVFSSLLESKITPMQTILFRNVLRALVTAFPNPTLATFQDLLLNGFDQYREHIDALRDDLKGFFYKQFNSKVYVDRRNEVLWRLDLLLSNDHIKKMLIVPKSTFNIAEAMDAGKIIIVNNSVAILGEQGSEFLGRFLVSQIWSAATARSGRSQADKLPCYVYIDEAHRVISRDEKIPQIIDECRSQKIALIISHQRTDQIASPNVLSALGNCALRYANSDEENRALAPKLRTTQDFLENLRVGQFGAFVRDLTPHAVALNVRKISTSELPRIGRSPYQPSPPAHVPPAPSQQAAHSPRSSASDPEPLIGSGSEHVAEPASISPIELSEPATRPATARPDEPRPAAAHRDSPADTEGAADWH